MILFPNRYPKLDLHGIDRDYARILINDFINDNYKIKNEKIIIIHGNGSGIIKKTTQDTLKKNKYVQDYEIYNFNAGMTVVTLKKRIDK